MSTKILYYLGAGASAQGLPTVKGIPDKVPKLSEAFTQVAQQLKEQNLGSFHQPLLDDVAKDLISLAEKSEEFGTIDTYAKYLFLKDPELLEKLKISLSFYFTFEQLWNNKIDKRYLIWLTSILNRPIFPDNIKILTWNYDFQLELAAESFHKESFIRYNTHMQASGPLIEYYPHVGAFNKKDNEYCLVHLNGIAGVFHDVKVGYTQSSFMGRSTKSKEDLINSFTQDINNKSHLLTFAWEKDTNSAYIMEKRLSLAKTVATDTTILVIIGYSFPFFNRDIDKEIFKTLKESTNLKKIYFQDPILDGSFLKNQFDLDSNIIIEHVNRTDLFFIPLEL